MSETRQIRRATLDDLPQLRSLWSKARLDSSALEKRLTEFQVVESNGVVACIGILVSNQQGLVHSEAVANFTQRDNLTPLLWERIQVLARNHGLHKLWIEDPDPRWVQLGFQPATAGHLKKLPAAFGLPKDYHVLQLKEETVATLTLEQEFELFSQAQKQSTEQILRQARNFKRMAYVLLWLAVAGLIAAIYFAFRRPVEIRRLGRPPEAFKTNGIGTNRF